MIFRCSPVFTPRNGDSKHVPNHTVGPGDALFVGRSHILDLSTELPIRASLSSILLLRQNQIQDSNEKEQVMGFVDLLLTHDGLFHNCISALADIEHHHKEARIADSYTAVDKNTKKHVRLLDAISLLLTRCAQQHPTTSSRRANTLPTFGPRPTQRNQVSLKRSTSTTSARAFRANPNSTTL